MSSILQLLITIVSFLLSLSFHEFCHALTAYALGDDTAKKQGRLTLNPLAHIDPLGFLFLILVRIGWAKPVPFDARNFKYPKLYSIIVGLAGPVSNFILALFFLYCTKYLPREFASTSFGSILSEFFKISISVNAMLGVFNLIPIPPLDGSHFIEALIPKSWQSAYYRFQPYSFILLIVLLNIPKFRELLYKSILFTIYLLSKLVV